MTSPVTRLSHVALRSPDVERMRTYYTEIIGLSSYDDGEGTVYLASGGRGPALELRSSPTAGIDHVGFEISAAKEEELLVRLKNQGVQVGTATDLEPGLVPYPRRHRRGGQSPANVCCRRGPRARGAGQFRNCAAETRSRRYQNQQCGGRHRVLRDGVGVPAGPTGWATSSRSCGATSTTIR